MQDAAVTVAEAVAAAYVSWARGEPAAAAAAGTSPGGAEAAAAAAGGVDAGSFARRGALLPALRATRALERFRNEVALRRWLHHRFGSVRELAEDTQPLWGFGPGAPRGTLRWRAVPLPRRAELDALTGLRRWVSLALEVADVVGPLLARAGRAASDAAQFLLVQLIGRALGLVARGVRQSFAPAAQPVQPVAPPAAAA
jgi:hypothetical protein